MRLCVCVLQLRRVGALEEDLLLMVGVIHVWISMFPLRAVKDMFESIMNNS
jgi:hypothetical protein